MWRQSFVLFLGSFILMASGVRGWTTKNNHGYNSFLHREGIRHRARFPHPLRAKRDLSFPTNPFKNKLVEKNSRDNEGIMTEKRDTEGRLMESEEVDNRLVAHEEQGLEVKKKKKVNMPETMVEQIKKMELMEKEKEKEKPLELANKVNAHLLQDWRVLLHNDDIHTFQFVEDSLLRVVPHLVPNKAILISNTVHEQGVGTVISIIKPLAEKICLALQSSGLTVTTAPEDKFES